ncbi:MAG: hypothetical protein VKI83_04950 [Synechococcaceae cyanobacterium]|nr:hypothetical protein [Synechococcaceae cyanobacterium]
MNLRQITRRQPIALALGTLLIGSLLLPPRSAAQDGGVPERQVRALNLARDTAVRLNGGLSVYRPADCMFATSDNSNPCLVNSNDQGFFFRFAGGPPGWQSQNIPPTRLTEIQISADGRQVVVVRYNGNPR